MDFIFGVWDWLIAKWRDCTDGDLLSTLFLLVFAVIPLGFLWFCLGMTALEAIGLVP